MLDVHLHMLLRKINVDALGNVDCSIHPVLALFACRSMCTSKAKLHEAIQTRYISEYYCLVNMFASLSCGTTFKVSYVFRKNKLNWD